MVDAFNGYFVVDVHGSDFHAFGVAANQLKQVVFDEGS